MSHQKYRVVRSADKKYLTPVHPAGKNESEQNVTIPLHDINELDKDQPHSPEDDKELLNEVLTCELEFENVVDPNYKQRQNFAILKLTQPYAKKCSSPFVATPLQPYSVKEGRREATSHGKEDK